MKEYRSLLILLFAIVGMVIIYWLLSASLIPKLENRGLFGDSFGGLTSVFSGLAFAGMIYAIVLQSKELRLQREELALTREELKASRKEQERAANAQIALVDQQLLAAKINGLSGIVQSRYQYAAAHGANAVSHLKQIEGVETLLLETMENAGLGKIELPKVQ